MVTADEIELVMQNIPVFTKNNRYGVSFENSTSHISTSEFLLKKEKDNKEIQKFV